MAYLNHLSNIILEVSPWLLMGLLTAGFVKAWLPETLVARWLGGTGIGPIIRGALVGAPLPLCSCSVIPIALGLRRNGASKPATVSFLVSTPETGVDSVLLSWAILGPFMTIARPIAAIISAIFSGFVTLILEKTEKKSSEKPAETIEKKEVCKKSSCCGGSPKPDTMNQTVWGRTWDGILYATSDLWNDIAPWITGGVLITAAVQTWLPPGDLQNYIGGGWIAMVLIVLTSIPVYVCATASTPMAAAMLYSGLTPGMTLAFLIAGPATNLAPLGILRKELGWRTTLAYLIGILVSAVLLGLLTDWITQQWHLAPPPESILSVNSEELIPVWLAVLSTLILTTLSLRSFLAKRWG